jgi:hypothetical protein
MCALTTRVAAGLGALTRVKGEVIEKARANLWRRRSSVHFCNTEQEHRAAAESQPGPPIAATRPNVR